MDDVRIGLALRALRRRLALRQIDLGGRARISQSMVSLVERGHVDGLSLRAIRRMFRALDADVVVLVKWRGGDLDRLLDERHARLAAAVSGLLGGLGWEVAPEVSYSSYGERGSIDLLAFHPPTGMVLVVELKTELTSIEETLRKHDIKVRLGPRVALERLGWNARSVGRLLVLLEGRTARRRVEQHEAVLRRVYPLRSNEIRRGLAAPAGAPSGLLFLSVSHHARGRQRIVAPKRVRRSASTAFEHERVAESLTAAPEPRPTRSWSLGDARSAGFVLLHEDDR